MLDYGWGLEIEPVEIGDMSLVNLYEHARCSCIKMDDGKVNAFSHDLIRELNAAWDKAESLAKPILLQGRESVFCAGFDLKEMKKGEREARELSEAGAEFARKVYQCDLPTMGVVTGHAIAMGAILLFAMDYNIGVTGGKRCGLNEVAIGLPMPVFAIELAKSRLTPSQVRQSVVNAFVVEDSEAVDAGFLDEIVDSAELEPRLESLIEHFSGLGPDAYKVTKRRVREELDFSLE